MPASHPAESRHLRTGSLNIPAPTGPSNGMMPAHPRFEGPRSPPNTAHVPCKFFRQGTCQAGSACPFSHDLALASETVCKYFAKGNCKFGPKCANIHLLPDGRRVNYSRGNFSIESAPIPMGNRVIPANYPQSSNSGLGNLFMRGDNNATYGPGPYLGEDDAYAHQLGRQPSIENGLPIIDTVHSSSPTPVYGSPRDEDHSRLGMGLSPVNAKVLSVMDAPLPASFDSNGISHAARYGPFPASVPSRLEPASPSLHNARDGRTSETLKLLHTSAFGSSDHLSPSNLPHDSSMGSSPPTWDVNGEYFGKRTMHSNALRHARPGLLSRSVPKVDRDWDSSEVLFEDYVPDSLANELLTPAEKARRGSMRAMDAEKSREIPNAPFTKYGSPIGGASPSRWGSYFQRQREEEDNSGLGRSMKHAVSQFGHVGSPLRNSSLANGDFNGRGGPTSSTSRNGVGSESLSALTQQFQRAKVSDDASGSSSSPHLHPNAARIGSGSAGIIGKERERDRGLERHVSNGSVSSSVTGRFTTPIDEEDPSFVFSMEEDDDAQTRARKRASGGLSLGTTTWSYAGIAAGKGSNGTGSRGSSNKTETVGNR